MAGKPGALSLKPTELPARYERPFAERGVKLTGNRCQCKGCGEYFNSASPFDGHRCGAFGTIRNPGTRRCLTVDEMLARGFLQNAAGFWITSKRPAGTVTSRGGAAIGADPLSTVGIVPLLPFAVSPTEDARDERAGALSVISRADDHG